ncbi:MAG: sulfur carrier protein ThiS [Verrucomicrobia bacterium]|nr:sulfur carrier protein ThiS [Verrucomicrobiota bacterium]
MTVRVNDKPHAIANAATLSQLLGELGLTERRGVAVAVNDAVVPRSTWTVHALADGDRVLVIQATQGG